MSHQVTNQGNLSRDFKRRILKSIEISQSKNIQTIILTSGVLFRGQPLSDLAFDYFRKNEIYPIRCILEKQSLDTVSEAIYSRKILDKLNFNKVYVITSDWHLKRVKYIFSKIFNEKYKVKYFGIEGFKTGWIIETKNKSTDEFKLWHCNCKKGDIKCYEKMLKKHHKLFSK